MGDSGEQRLQDVLEHDAGQEPADPYVEAADANPERRENGCMIYRVGDRG